MSCEPRQRLSIPQMFQGLTSAPGPLCLLVSC